MKKENYIPIQQLCVQYQVEETFFISLQEHELVEFIMVKETYCVHENKIAEIERIIRLYTEFDMTTESIDIVLNLLQKIEGLQTQLKDTQSRLNFYEGK